MVADKVVNKNLDPGTPVPFADNGAGGYMEVVALGKQFNAGGYAAAARLLSAAASVNATLVKGSVGRVYHICGYNAAAAVRYLKLYNKATSPTVGTDTPVLTLALAPSAAFTFAYGDIGFSFSSGIGFGLTVNNADADATAVTAADIVGLNITYA